MQRNLFPQPTMLRALFTLWLASSGTAAGAGEAATPAGAAGGRTVRVLVAYYSLTGNTKSFAQGVAEGTKRVGGAVAIVKQVDRVDPGISEKELDGARRLGERMARLAKKLRAD